MIVRSRSSISVMNQSPRNEKEVMITLSPPNLKSLGSIIKRWKYHILILCTLILCGLYFMSLPHTYLAKSSSQKLSVVMNTFERHDMMTEAVEYYSKCDLVKYIHIIWSESKPPPPKLVEQYKNRVSFSIQETGSLNNRFRPLDGPHLDAILSVDDDMRISCGDLNLAYDVWRSSPRSMVGFMPRMHLRQADGQLVYRCWWRVWWHGWYSIILTKAAIMHHDFFGMYTHSMPQSIRDLVDSKRNCEDIAMQFLMANSTGLPPIYVKGHLDDLGAVGGISTSQNFVTAKHMSSRSDCLNQLAEIYGRVPLVESRMIVDSASNGWTNAPSTWFEYLSSDLWKW